MFIILHISATARLTWQISSALPMLAKQPTFLFGKINYLFFRLLAPQKIIIFAIIYLS